MSDTTPNPENRSFPWHWIVLGLLVVAQAGLGAYAAGRFDSGMDDVDRRLMTGFLLSQPLLLAFWAAFSPQRFYQRFLWSVLLCAMVLFVDELGPLPHMDSHVGKFMMMSSAIFVLATMLLLAIRRILHWQITHPLIEHSHTDYQGSQFGIKHLVALITITAIACGLLRSLLLMNRNVDWLPSVSRVVSYAVGNVGLLCPVIILPWYVMAYRPRIGPLIVSTTIIGVGCELAAFAILMTSPQPLFFVERMLFMQLGAGLSVLISTTVMRLCGFRMVRVPKSGSAGS